MAAAANGHMFMPTMNPSNCGGKQSVGVQRALRVVWPTPCGAWVRQRIRASNDVLSTTPLGLCHAPTVESRAAPPGL